MTELVSAISQYYQAGDDLLLRFFVTDDDGVAVNMTGMSFVFVVVSMGGLEVISTESTSATATVIEDDTGYVIDLALGSYGIFIAGSVTANLNDTYKFVSKVIDTLGKVATVARGYLTFEQGIG